MLVVVVVKDKEKLLAATPAIQPVSNADLKRIASGFGYRIDPVYKTVKLHPGLDFAAPALVHDKPSEIANRQSPI